MKHVVDANEVTRITYRCLADEATTRNLDLHQASTQARGKPQDQLLPMTGTRAACYLCHLNWQVCTCACEATLQLAQVTAVDMHTQCDTTPGTMTEDMLQSVQKNVNTEPVPG